MVEQNKKISETLKDSSLPVKILLICLLPAIVIYAIVDCFLPAKQKEFWEKHVASISIGITALLIVVPLMLANKNTDSVITENTNGSSAEISQIEPDEEDKDGMTAAEEEAKRIEDEARKAEEEEKARLAEEEKAKKAAEEAEKQRQKEAILREQMSRASAAFANPLGHKGEIIAVTGSIIVDYAYRPNDTNKYTSKLPVGAGGWGGFWIDTQYGKCYALYDRTGGGPQKEYHTGDTITFVGKVISDESTYEPMNGIYAPLWLQAMENF